MTSGNVSLKRLKFKLEQAEEQYRDYKLRDEH